MPAHEESSPIEALDMFQKTEQLSDDIWQIVVRWDYFAKDTVGKQLVRATDSIGANLAESDGRYHFKEKLNFCYIARGSLKETCYWLRRARQRQLVAPQQVNDLLNRIKSVHRFINSLISKRRQWIAELREESEEYTID